MTADDPMDRYEPVPVPLSDGRHDIGDDVRAAIVRRLIEEWSRDPDLSPEKVRQLAMWAGASVRSLLHELGTLRDMGAVRGPGVEQEQETRTSMKIRKPRPGPDLCADCDHERRYHNAIGCGIEQCGCQEFTRTPTSHHCACVHDGRGGLVSECQEHGEIRLRAEAAESALTAVREQIQAECERLQDEALGQGAIYGSGLIDAATRISALLREGASSGEQQG